MSPAEIVVGAFEMLAVFGIAWLISKQQDLSDDIDREMKSLQLLNSKRDAINAEYRELVRKYRALRSASEYRHAEMIKTIDAKLRELREAAVEAAKRLNGGG